MIWVRMRMPTPASHQPTFSSAKERPTADQSVCQAIQLRSTTLIASRASLLMDDDLLFPGLGPGLLEPAMVLVDHVETQSVAPRLAQRRYDDGELDAFARRQLLLEEAAAGHGDQRVSRPIDQGPDVNAGQLVGAEAPTLGADVAHPH